MTATTVALRAEADQINAGLREDHRALWEAARHAAQLKWTADLIDAAELAAAEANGARSRMPQLENAVTEAVGAERAAQDRVRAETGKLTRVLNEQARADPCDGDAQERIAVRVAARRPAVAACEQAVAAATGQRQAAEHERDTWQAYVNELEAEDRQAQARAADPGPAPDLPAMPLGVATPDDYDDGVKRQIALALGTAMLSNRAASPPDGPQPKGGLGVTRGGLADQDSRGFRFARYGQSTVVIPPAR